MTTTEIYKLRAVLQGHTADVRQVGPAPQGQGAIVSASRDKWVFFPKKKSITFSFQDRPNELADSDPHGFALILEAGYRYQIRISEKSWIRIRIKVKIHEC